MLRKYFAQLLIVCLLFTVTFTQASAQLFTDVKETHGSYAQLQYLVNQGIIEADAATAFRIGEPITRYEAAEWLVKALKLDTELRPIPTYTDVAEDDARMAVIATVTELGIMTGTDGAFNPDRSLTRAQAAGILTRAFSLTGESTATFPDVAPTHWAAASVSALIANQITTGFEDGTFRLNAPLTRGNFAVFIARVLEPSFRLAKNDVPAPAPAPQPAPSCEKESTKTTYKVDVSVANLWKHYNNARSVDSLSTTNPVDYDRWIAGLSLSQKKWLVDRTDTQALYGDEVTVLETRGKWLRVAAKDQYVPYQKEGYPGWVPASQITKTTKNYDDCAIAIITAKQAPLYEADYKQVHIEVSYATILPIIKESGNYYVVQTPSNGTKLLKKGHAKAFDDYSDVPKPSAQTIVDEAKRYLNLPYLWAGTSSWGYDCSGILYAVFRAHGIMIPRDSFYQATKGKAVAKKDLQAGDLVFFAYNGGKGKVYHVGLYIGNGQMLHAPNYASKVRIEPLNAGVYKKNYSGARRYL
ncbi:MAG: S-layer homology domain-containing protein [Caryophanon sp.]|nr:S-layer homology domain-containing protein [Caryophanon sp.]